MGLGMPIRVNRNTTMINLGDDGDRDDDDNVSTMYQVRTNQSPSSSCLSLFALLN